MPIAMGMPVAPLGWGDHVADESSRPLAQQGRDEERSEERERADLENSVIVGERSFERCAFPVRVRIRTRSTSIALDLLRSDPPAIEHRSHRVDGVVDHHPEEHRPGDHERREENRDAPTVQLVGNLILRILTQVKFNATKEK